MDVRRLRPVPNRFPVPQWMSSSCSIAFPAGQTENDDDHDQDEDGHEHD
jgi:hypothetical protein